MFFFLDVIFVHKYFQVIKKVMKMDAAEPFNIPVDPVALQIPVSSICTFQGSIVHCSGKAFLWAASRYLIS